MKAEAVPRPSEGLGAHTRLQGAFCITNTQARPWTHMHTPHAPTHSHFGPALYASGCILLELLVLLCQFLPQRKKF